MSFIKKNIIVTKTYKIAYSLTNKSCKNSKQYIIQIGL